MCLAVPMKVIEITDNTAVAEFDGVTRRARVDLLGDVAIGDYILVHAGLAIAKVKEEDALETLRAFRELSAP